MNGYDLYKKAILRLGFNPEDKRILQEGQLARALEIINQIALDLKQEPLSELYEELAFEKDVLEALCCGVAMQLSLIEGEVGKNQVWTVIYNAKRASVLGNVGLVEDTLPIVQSEE